jgi:hypothetical protein
MAQNFIIVISVIIPYALVSWALIGVSILIVNHLSIDTQPTRTNRTNRKVINTITATQNNYRKTA